MGDVSWTSEGSGIAMKGGPYDGLAYLGDGRSEFRIWTKPASKKPEGGPQVCPAFVYARTDERDNSGRVVYRFDRAENA